MLYKYGKRTWDFSGRFYLFSFLHFKGVFNRTIIPPALVEYMVLLKTGSSYNAI